MPIAGAPWSLVVSAWAEPDVQAFVAAAPLTCPGLNAMASLNQHAAVNTAADGSTGSSSSSSHAES